MLTRTRLTGLAQWMYRELCKGRQMKAPGIGMDVGKRQWQEPKVFIGYAPGRPDSSRTGDPLNVAPGILIMPRGASYGKLFEEEYQDHRYGIHRPQEMGRQLGVDILFAVYEDGIRLPGFQAAYESGQDYTPYLAEGTNEGLFTLTDWMDDLLAKLNGVKVIPGTDLRIKESSMTYGPASDSNWITDKRPIFYGFVGAVFYTYADQENDEEMRALLD